MTEALGVVGSVIAVTTLAWNSSKRLYELVDGLSNAPEAISHTKANLSTTQNAIQALKENLTTDNSAVFDTLLQAFRVAEVLEGSHKECDRFSRKIETYTKHSRDATFSKRDRFILNFHESEIKKFNGRLQDHGQIIMLVTTSMNQILSESSSTVVRRLNERFARQETEFTTLNAQMKQLGNLQSLSLSYRTDESAGITTEDHDRSINSISRPQSICQEAISAASDAKPIKQTFGDVSVDNSRHFEGIAGTAQSNVTQTYGKAVVTNGSTVVRGQLDTDTFKIMFGTR